MFKKALTATALLTTLVAATTAMADNQARWFNVTNVGDYDIMFVYASNVDSSGWGGDLLGSSIIPIGQTMTVEPYRHDGYCMFDIKVEFADNSATTAMGVNICQITGIVVDDWGNYSLNY